MQHHISFNIVTGIWVFNSLFIMTAVVEADSYTPQPFPDYFLQSVAERPNPWALPEQAEQAPGFQRFRKYRSPYSQNSQGDSTERDNQPQGGRFVTPEILESLKQQQMQTQMLPDRRRYNKLGPRKNRSRSGGQSYYGTSPYGASPYGTGFANPLYDAPAISPWGGGPDIIYRGQSFPLVPDEAVGGLPPMHVPSFGMKGFNNDYMNKGYRDEADRMGIENYTQPENGPRTEDNVFNPFTFIPNKNLR